MSEFLRSPLFIFFAIFIPLAVLFGRNPLQQDIAKIKDPLGTSIERKLTNENMFNLPGPSSIGSYAGSYAPIVSGQLPQPPGKRSFVQQSAVPEYYLMDGRRVFFTGIKVFTLAKDGQLIALPDGDYVLQGGSKMVIRAGRRMP